MNRNQIKLRLALAELLIQALEKDEDPRAPAALERVKGQKAELEAMLAEQSVQGPSVIVSDEPVAQVVGLKTLRLTGTTQLGG